MNTPQQQAELYRKAAETIEMCAPHGIEPMVKHCGSISPLNDWRFNGNADFYEFPISVIKGQLMWKGTPIYDKSGKEITGDIADIIIKNGILSVGMDEIWYQLLRYTLTKPKQPLCEVEGKPVFYGDMLWLPKYNVAQYVSACWSKEDFEMASWNPSKRTVMVELTIEDAERLKKEYSYGAALGTPYHIRIEKACRKALDNLK